MTVSLQMVALRCHTLGSQIGRTTSQLGRQNTEPMHIDCRNAELHTIMLSLVCTNTSGGEPAVWRERASFL